MTSTHLTLSEARIAISNKKITPKGLIEEYVQRINNYNSTLHSFLSVRDSTAVTDSTSLDETANTDLPLFGMPIAIKDNLLRKGDSATGASKILENYTAPFTATVVERLENAGAVIIGRTNLDEFAMGSSTEHSAYGDTKNPWDISRVPGGSSGGSAAAVAADLSIAALGSDTGGSIRQPASFCGIVGYKPTYGAVSRYGLMAMASSLDQVGLLSKTVTDAAIVTEVIAGKDSKDATTSEKSLGNLSAAISSYSVKGKVFGLPKEFFNKDLDKNIREMVMTQVHALEKMGAGIREVSLPTITYSLPVYYIIMSSEVSANMSRYDGMRYGLSDRSGTTLESTYRHTRSKGFGEEVKRRIMLGTYTLSSGYYDAYYGRAQKVRTKIKNEFDTVFKTVDAIICPTTPTTAFRIGENVNDPVTMYLQDIFTVPANIAGLPAISIPVGLSKGLPVGLQVIGKAYNDSEVLGVAGAIEINASFERIRYSE